MPGADEIGLRGGREVHWSSSGGVGPAVLLLSGCGLASTVWDSVDDLLPDDDVVRLDRPGLGGTTWPEELPSLAQEVQTLADLTGRLTGPVLIVAHSMAGFHAEALARLHPELVAGLVLVDASVEWPGAVPPATTPRMMKVRGEQAWLAVARLVHHGLRLRPLLSLVGLAARMMVNLQSHRHVLARLDDATRTAYRDRDAAAMAIAEFAAFDRQAIDLAGLRERSPWPQLPVIVLAALADGDVHWAADQRRLADLLGGRLEVAQDSRHLIMIDRPDLVADAVHAMHDS